MFRVVFVGDSWTYGMGVSEEEAFPHQFEILANQHSGIKKTIEAWTLALPGYNTVNQLAAIDAFFDQIQPDAIVLCPTINDIDSTLGVSPQGRLMRNLVGPKPFLDVKRKPIDSYLTRTLWKQAFDAIQQTALRLKGKSVPFFMFFVAGWDEAMIHSSILHAGIQAPYIIVPQEYCYGKWHQPLEKFGHGTPEAYVIFAKIVLQMIAENLGWKQLPEKVTTQDGVPVITYKSPPSGNWDVKWTQLLKERVKNNIPDNFTAGSDKNPWQCWGAMDYKTRAMARSTLIVLSRKHNSSQLTIFIKPIPRAQFLYPLELQISIPSPSGGISQSVEISEEGADIQRFTVPIPHDISPDTAIDIIFQVSRTVVDSNFVAKSLYIAYIEQN